MAKKRAYHIRSNQTTTVNGVTQPKLPTINDINVGELAINYKDGFETLSIRNDNDEIVTFATLEQLQAYIENEAKLSENYQTSALTGNALALAAGDNLDTFAGKLEKQIEENELVISSALNDLNSRVTNLSLPDDYEKSSLPDGQLDLNPGDSYNNAFGKLEAQIESDGLVTSAALNDLNSRVTNVENNPPELSSNYQTSTLTNSNLRLQPGENLDTVAGKLEKVILDDETITAAALNDLNRRKLEKITGGVSGNLVIIDSNGNVVDSGFSANEIEGTDTKNTAGSTNTSNKLYIIGAETQDTNPQTYSQGSVYIGNDGKLRSGFGINSATDSESIVATENYVETAIEPKADKVPEVNHGTSDTTFTLTPNIMHIWGEVETLNLSLSTDSNSVLDEYMFTFTCPSTAATNLTLPASIKWIQQPELQAGKTYQVSIVNGLAGYLTDDMPTAGDENVIEEITVNGTTVPVVDKVATITGTVSSVTVNGSNYTPDANGLVNLGTISGESGSGGEYNVIEGVTFNGNTAPITNKIAAITYTAPTLAKGTTTGSGNAVTDISVSGHTITLTKGTTFLTSYTETDPTVPAAVKAITATDISNWNNKQAALVSGTNIKTINGNSILGEGNISISGASGGEANVIESVKVNGTALTVTNKAVDITAVPASIVTQDATHRFVSDTEKSTWNNKANDTDVLHKTGYEIITGSKTITNQLNFIPEGTEYDNYITSASGTLILKGEDGININGDLNLINGSSIIVDNIYAKTTANRSNAKIFTTNGNIIDLPTLSKGTTTGNGNAVTDISVNGHTVTLTKGSTFLTSHQSIKTLNTNNTTAQTANASEAIAGSGTINLHKVAKTGSYNDLLNKPTIPTALADLTADATHRLVTDTEKSAWNNKASDTGVVHLAGQETITGIKRFEDKIYFGDPFYSNYIEQDPSENGNLIISANNKILLDIDTTISGTLTINSGNSNLILNENGITTSVTGQKSNHYVWNTNGGYTNINGYGFITSSDIPSLSKGTTTGSGNAVTDINVSGHEITLVKNESYLKLGEPLQPVNTFTQDSKNFYLEPIMDSLWAADKRWNVSAEIQTGNNSTTLSNNVISELFNGHYSSTSDVKFGNNETLVITISANPSSYLYLYSSGQIILNFYYLGLPASVSGRIYHGSSRHWTNLSFSKQRGQTNGIYISDWIDSEYAEKIELTIVGQTLSVDPNETMLSSIEWWRTRAEVNDYPVVNKYSAQTLYYPITAPAFVTTGGSSSQFVKGDGSLDSNTYVTASNLTTIYSGSSAPSSSLGNNGDIYIKVS